MLKSEKSDERFKSKLRDRLLRGKGSEGELSLSLDLAERPLLREALWLRRDLEARFLD